ncbi:MAG: O-antigen ligase family protein [Candidatus Kapaibacterium sp.]
MTSAHQRSWWSLEDAHVHPLTAVLAGTSVVAIVAVSAFLEWWFLPAVVFVGIAVVFFGMRTPELWLYAVALSLPVFFSSSEVGVSATDVALGVFLIGGLYVWLLHAILVARRRLVENAFDALLVLYMVFMTVNVVVAVVHGTTVLDWLRSYSIGVLVLYYFPVRTHCSDLRVLRRFVFVLTVVVVGLTLKSIIDYRSIVKASEYAFQIAGRRVIPHVFLMASLSAFVWAVHDRLSWRRIVPMTIALLFVVGLVTTYARTTWLGFLFCIIIGQYFLLRKERRRTVIMLVGFAAITYGGITIVFGPTAALVTKVIANRFTSSSNVKKDQAVGNRVYESRTVARYIERNPISGYGLAAVYKGYDGIIGQSIPKTYIHNGLFAPVFSFGLVGALLQYCVLIAAVVRSFLVARRMRTTLARVIAVSCFLTLTGMFIENITAAIFFFRSAVFVLAFALAGVSIAERFDEEPRSCA